MAVVGSPTFFQRDANGTQATSASRTVTAGNWLLAIIFVDVFALGSDTNITFSDSVTPDLTWNEVAAVDQFNGTDGVVIEAAYATFAAGGAITVTATQNNSTVWMGGVLVEMSGISAFDTATYLRTTTTTPRACGSATNANANATRVAACLAWGGGTVAADTGGGYTDGGAGASYGGINAVRVMHRQETSAVSRNPTFAAGTGTNPFHGMQFIFSETGGGGGGGGGARSAHYNMQRQ